MTVLNDFTDQIMVYRKAHNPLAKSMQLVLAETARIEKSNSARAATDADLFKTLKNTIAGLKEVIDLSQRAMTDEHAQIVLFEKYLPSMMTEDELKASILAIMIYKDLAASDGMRSMGVVMKELKLVHPGQYDGKMASNIFKDLIK